MGKRVRDYTEIMYHDTATKRMLDRDGDSEIETLSIAKLAELSTYVPAPIDDNPFAHEVCRKAQGDNCPNHITFRLYKQVCKGAGIEIY
jgi:hypothetical protein